MSLRVQTVPCIKVRERIIWFSGQCLCAFNSRHFSPGHICLELFASKARWFSVHFRSTKLWKTKRSVHTNDTHFYSFYFYCFLKHLLLIFSTLASSLSCKLRFWTAVPFKNLYIDLPRFIFSGCYQLQFFYRAYTEETTLQSFTSVTLRGPHIGLVLPRTACNQSPQRKSAILEQNMTGIRLSFPLHFPQIFLFLCPVSEEFRCVLFFPIIFLIMGLAFLNIILSLIAEFHCSFFVYFVEGSAIRSIIFLTDFWVALLRNRNFSASISLTLHVSTHDHCLSNLLHRFFVGLRHRGQ